ncbi:isoprenoid synthase domain-containing protein [Cyathus striatus]|nr:isoprenoid synthase domain-containing protein [Cyathus striatus]
MVSQVPTSFLVLPDIFRICPLKDAVNPHFAAAAANPELGQQNTSLTAHAYPYAEYDQFRLICDWMSLLFIVDEVTDDQTGKDAEATGLCVIKALEDEGLEDDSLMTEMVKSFRKRLVPHGTPDMLRRFINRVKQYMHAVTKEAELRNQNEVPDLETFIPLRRHNSAVVSCLALVEYGIGVDVSDEMWENDILLSAVWAVVDFVAFSNDLFSYDMEQAKNLEGNNLITVIMKEKGLNLQEATNYVGDICKELMDAYLKAKEDLQQLDVGEDVIRYVEAIGCWTIGSVEWSFEGGRYFGSFGDEIRKTRIVRLRPPELPVPL